MKYDYGLTPLKFWCQKVLPLVYDESLSYEELLCKVVAYLNNVIEDVKELPEYIKELISDERLKELISELLDDLREQIARANEGENITASYNRSKGELVWLDGKLIVMTRSILAGDRYVEDTGDESITGNFVYTSVEIEIQKIKNDVESDIESLQNGLASEANTRSDADTALQNNINSVNSAIRKDIIEVINLAERGLDSSGQTDCYAKFNEILDEVETGSTLYFPHGVYWFTKPIVIDKWVNLLGDGTSSVLTFTEDGIEIKYDRCNVSNLMLIPLTNGYTGLYCEGDFCRISNVFFKDAYDDSNKYWGKSLHLYDPWYTVVSNVQINDYKASNYRNGVGIQLTACVNLILENVFVGFKNIGIRCDNTEVNDHACDGVQIEGGNIVTCNQGVKIEAGSNYFFNNLLLDQIYQYCYNLSNMGYMYVSDSYIAILSARGTSVQGTERIVTANTCTQLNFNNCTLRGRTELQVGIAFYDCNHVSINGGDIMQLTDALVFNTEHSNYCLAIVGNNFISVTGKTFNISKCNLICSNNNNVSADSLYGSNVIPLQRTARISATVEVNTENNYFTVDIPTLCGWTPTSAIANIPNVNKFCTVKVITVNASTLRLQLYSDSALGDLGNVTFEAVLFK